MPRTAPIGTRAEEMPASPSGVLFEPANSIGPLSRPSRSLLPRLSPGVIADVVKGLDLLLLTVLSYLAWILHSQDLKLAHLHLYVAGTILGVLLWAMLSRSADLYAFPTLWPKRRLIKAVVCWGGVIGSLLVLAATLPSADAEHYGAWLLLWSAGGLIALTISHVITVEHLSALTRSGHLVRDVVILGAGELGWRLAQHIDNSKAYGLRVVGLFDDRGTRLASSARPRLLGDFRDALAFARRSKIACIIIALPLHAEARIMELVRRVTEAPVDVYLASDAIGFHLSARGNPNIGGLPVIPAAEKPIKEWQAVLKSLEDKTIAAIALIVFSPLLAAVAVAIKIDSPGPVLFRQPRCGFNEKIFYVYKFRTMYVEASDLLGDRLVVRGDRRVTRLGAILRRLSLDELPQLFNVMLGQMSIVGPRPHPVNAKAANLPYSEVVAHYASRHRVKPGITGWAQINGWRGETDTYEKIEKRVQHDLYYIENWSIAFDLWIIFVTFFRGFYHREAY
jgi:Undecaprenyl-phosphate glucose phosphotransferase